jgi:hypothetical protein
MKKSSKKNNFFVIAFLISFAYLLIIFFMDKALV